MTVDIAVASIAASSHTSVNPLSYSFTHTVDSVLFNRFYTSTVPSEPGVSHVFKVKTDEAANVFHESVCLTCDLGDECKFNEVSLSVSGSYYTINCLGPGVPKTILRKTCGTSHPLEPSK